MDIYQFFSCITKLPIRIDSILEFLRERGIAEHVFFCEVDVDPAIMWAQMRAYRSMRMYGDDKIVYEIQFSKHLTVPQKRLACCKELLHILDEEAEMASTQAQVEELIQQMSIPPHSGISLPTANDHFGLIRALLILVPRDCLSEFKAAYDSGKMTDEEVARATQVPVEYARLTLQDFWQKLSSSIS